MNLVIIGSCQHYNPNSHKVCLELADRLKNLDGKFITGGESGGPPCTFVHSLPEKRRKDVIFVVPKNYKTEWGVGDKDELKGSKTIMMGETDEERQQCLSEMGDVFIMIEGGPGAANEARMALKMGKQVFAFPHLSPFAKEIYDEAGVCFTMDSLCKYIL